MFYLIIFSAELRRQADLLVARSVSAGTRKNYDAAVEKLISFCHSNKIKDKFAPSTIELFVTHLSQQQHLSYSTIQANLSALRHNCHVKHMPVDFDTPRLKLLLRGIKKSSSSSGVPARCTSRVSNAHLKRLCVAADVLFDTTYARMIKAIFTVAFFGLLRPSEFARSKLTPKHQLKRKCARFGKNILMLTFCSYKHSDQVVSIKIDKYSDDFLCPWSNLFNYLTHTVLRADDPLFAISASEFSDILSRCASQAGIKTRLTPHSFRRGGATWFSSNGMTDAKLKAYGRWSSNAYLCYVKAD